MDDQAQTTASQQHPPFLYPVPDFTTPFWRTELHPLDSQGSTQEPPQTCDMVIIGAGYTGAAIAYHLLDGNESAGSSTVILEARECVLRSYRKKW
jgi:pyruvate/2-oxoglutarate dehydrogenase complex dihydrolipoamide dehydrogenase (E3) component